MKRILFFLLLFAGHRLTAQNVGVGTNTPIARLHVADSSVLFTGPTSIAATTTFSPPQSGAGVRLFWYPQKASFRFGEVAGSFWDKDSIGNHSFASGYNTKAKGQYSISLGANSEAIADYSIALGGLNTAAGPGAVTIGALNYAPGEFSTALGFNNKAKGNYSFASGSDNNADAVGAVTIGLGNETTGLYGAAIGYYNKAIGNGSFAAGSSTLSYAPGSIALGLGVKATSFGSTVVGTYNELPAVFISTEWSGTEPIFLVGNGQSEFTRSTAMVVTKNGMMGIGTMSPAVSSSNSGLHVKNNGFMQLRLESSSSSAGIEMRAAGSAHSWEMQTSVNDEWFMYDRTANQYRLLIKGTGEVGIGTVSPSQKLHVNGSVLATAYNLISDARFKINVQPMTAALEKLNAIRGVYYEYQNNSAIVMDLPAGRQTGVIAQEVEKELPEAVTTTKEGFLTVDYTKLVPLLIESVKELELKINAQQKEIDSLKKQLNKKQK